MYDVRSTHTTVPFDLYRDIHKAIRVALFDVTAQAARVDPADRAARIAHAGRVRDLVRFLALHAEHEDRTLDAAIRETLPEQAAAIAADHVALEERMIELVELADLAFDDTRDDARAALHDLYLELAAFTSAYLAHQDVEERVVMPALWTRFGIEPLLEIHGRILASITPDDMARSLSWMLPAMNVEDRTEMLGGMKASAPAEAFAGVCALAAEVLAPADHRALRDRLELEPVAAGR
jgi:hypothetical protein